MPRKYVWGFHTLQICEDMIVPWPNEKFHRIVLSLRKEQNRKGKKFYWEGRPSGLYIKRLK